MKPKIIIHGVDVTKSDEWIKLEPRIKRRKANTQRAYITDKELSQMFWKLFGPKFDTWFGGLGLYTALNSELRKVGVHIGARNLPRPRNKSDKSFAQMTSKWDKKYKPTV
jgi:hypothetical protein